MKKLILVAIFGSILVAKECYIAQNIKPFVVTSNISKLKYISDVRQNYKALKDLCVSLISFKEAIYNWKMLLVTNPNRPIGPFWYLPHDNENSAFKAAIYATKKYGGGFLAVVNNNKRYYLGQDPNRNFSLSSKRVCKDQHFASPIYTSVVFNIINSYKSPNMPYLALHNNTNGGGISILKTSSKTKSFLAYKKSDIKRAKGGLADEDSLIFIAGVNKNPPMHKIDALRQKGINVKYEIVTPANNDCSMSNFVVLNLNTTNYYNIETQHKDTATAIKMIDRLFK